LSANAFVKLRNYEQAVVHFNNVAKWFPKGHFPSAALFKAAEAYEELGDESDEKLALQRVISDYPKSSEAPLARDEQKRLPADPVPATDPQGQAKNQQSAPSAPLVLKEGVAGYPTGIDVSRWRSVGDWGALKKDGISFVFVKATEGNALEDPAFEANWRNCRKAGLLCAPYHVFRGGQIAKETQNVIDNIPREQGALPLAVMVLHDDLAPALRSAPPAAVEAKLEEFLDEIVRKTNRRPIVYLDEGSSRLSNFGKLSQFPMWVRHLGGSPPNVPWTFWHSTDQAVVGGINKPVDRSFYNGSYADLQKLVSSRGAM
jgi:lysozyme